MANSNDSPQNGNLLLRSGVLLFFFALLVGLAVPHFAVPRLGLSAHILGITQGIFLMVAGLAWPRLALGPGASRVAMGLLLYGCFSAWVANLLAGVLSIGASILPMAAGAARGSPLQEGLVKLGLKTAAVSLIAATAMMWWGLRAKAKAAAALEA